MKSAKKHRSISSQKYLTGKIRIYSLVIVTLGVLAYVLFSHVLPKDTLPTVINVEPETQAARRGTTITDPVIIEAENMAYLSSPDGIQVVVDPLASGGAGKQLSFNNSVLTAVTLQRPVSKVIVTAKGERCHGGPAMVLTIGGTTVIDRKVTTTSWSDYSANVSLQPGSYNVIITFNNDSSSSSGQGCDRSLSVDKITLQ